jgi:hypothetical protein
MTDIKTQTDHPTELELAEFLSRSLSSEDRERIEDHIASCDECLDRIVLAHESVESYGRRSLFRKGKIMNKINIYLVLAILSFILSFAMPRHFIQFLVATLLLGIKWIVDSKSTKMLVMIYEAWKKGGEKEASRILEAMDSKSKKRF